MNNPKISFDRFESELGYRVSTGRDSFVGSRTKNRYFIRRNSGSKTKGWSLFVNDSPVKTLTSFFSVACEIWDRETGR